MQRRGNRRVTELLLLYLRGGANCAALPSSAVIPKGGFSFQPGTDLAWKWYPCSRQVGAEGGLRIVIIKITVGIYANLSDGSKALAEPFGFFLLKLAGNLSHQVLTPSASQNSPGFNT